MTRWRALQIWFGQWRQRVLKRLAERLDADAEALRQRADCVDKRAAWWARWVHRRLP